jgi:hypothetical protein
MVPETRFCRSLNSALPIRQKMLAGTFSFPSTLPMSELLLANNVCQIRIRAGSSNSCPQTTPLRFANCTPELLPVQQGETKDVALIRH